MATSQCANYLVAADPSSNIAAWVLKNNQYSFYCKLPRYKSAPTALGIHPKLLNLVVAYADNNVSVNLSLFLRKFIIYNFSDYRIWS